MPWIKLCDAELSVGRAASYTVEGTNLLVMHCKDGYHVLTPVCPHVPRFLVQEDTSECVDAGVPKCNRHIGPDGRPASLGICDEPVFAYASKEAAGSVYVDLGKRRLAPYQRITCSPVLKDGAILALQFSLWRDGEHKESIYAGSARTLES